MPENIILSANSFLSVLHIVSPLILVIISIILYILIPKWIEQSGQHGYDKKIEELKGEITKNNETLNAVVQSYFTSSEKLLDKKVEACSTLWQSTLSIIDRRYENGNVEEKRAIIGSIFPEFLVFDGTQHRTARINSAVALIYQNNNELEHKNNGTNLSFLDLSQSVTPFGFEP